MPLTLLTIGSTWAYPYWNRRSAGRVTSRAAVRYRTDPIRLTSENTPFRITTSDSIASPQARLPSAITTTQTSDSVSVRCSSRLDSLFRSMLRLTPGASAAAATRTLERLANGQPELGLAVGQRRDVAALPVVLEGRAQRPAGREAPDQAAADVPEVVIAFHQQVGIGREVGPLVVEALVRVFPPEEQVQRVGERVVERAVDAPERGVAVDAFLGGPLLADVPAESERSTAIRERVRPVDRQLGDVARPDAQRSARIAPLANLAAERRARSFGPKPRS